MPYYLTPKQDGFNKIPEIQICIVAEALYDVDSIVVDPFSIGRTAGQLLPLCYHDLSERLLSTLSGHSLRRLKRVIKVF